MTYVHGGTIDILTSIAPSSLPTAQMKMNMAQQQSQTRYQSLLSKLRHQSQLSQPRHQPSQHQLQRFKLQLSHLLQRPQRTYEANLCSLIHSSYRALWHFPMSLQDLINLQQFLFLSLSVSLPMLYKPHTLTPFQSPKSRHTKTRRSWWPC